MEGTGASALSAAHCCTDGKYAASAVVAALNQETLQKVWTLRVCEEEIQHLQLRQDHQEDTVALEDVLGRMIGKAWPDPLQPMQTLPKDDSKGWVAWVSIDPRTAEPVFYEGHIASRIEGTWQDGKSSIGFGPEFYNAVVYMPPEAPGKAYQVRMSETGATIGYRDVRRVEGIQPGERVTFWITGEAGSYRISEAANTKHSWQRCSARLSSKSARHFIWPEVQRAS